MNAAPEIPGEPTIIRHRSKPGWFLLILGVLFPASVLVIELVTRMCAVQFFDPMPTTWHVLLVAFVPLANLAAWLRARGAIRTRLLWLQIANGAAIGVAAYFTLMFLPLMPLAAVAIILMGIGILPFAPLVSLLAGLRLKRHLRFTAEAEQVPKRRWVAYGVAISVAAILALELPITLTRVGMQMTASKSPETAAKGIGLLRLVGNEGVMLHACYMRTSFNMELVGLFTSTSASLGPAQAREIFYRVTGRPFTSQPVPWRIVGSGRFGPGQLDMDVGGERVAGKIYDLSVDSSRIDGSVDGDGALAYLEWTLVFKNRAQMAHEAGPS